MKTKRPIVAYLAVPLALCLLASGCGTVGGSGNSLPTSSGSSSSPSGAAEPTASSDIYAPEDLDASWEDASAVSIELKGSSVDISGNGASAEGGTITISQAGTYRFSGTLDDGQIVVAAPESAVVRLVLDNVSLSNSTSAAIYAKTAAKTILVLPEGSENTVSDGAEYVYAAGEDEPDAAIFAKDDLTITGGGSLTVAGNFHNGIGSKDILRITGGSISVTAVNDGLRGRDGVAILDGNFTIRADNDGIKANHDTDTEKGYVLLDGGVFDIISGCDGVQAETGLMINGGTYAITTGGGASAAPQKQTQNAFPGRGNTAQTTTAEVPDESTGDSKKALKAGASLMVTSGIFYIDAEDDGVHSNGDLLISGGDFTVSAGDDGFHADNNLTVEDGSIIIETSYEGLEGATVNINGGILSIRASDDGINAAGGSDGNTGTWGQDRFSASGDYYIHITDGSLTVDSGTDGLDSNGKLTIDGGTLFIHGPTSGGDSALDADGAIEVNGGNLFAVGAAGMHQEPGDNSTQLSLIVYFTETVPEGTPLHLTDESGLSVAELTTVKTAQAAVISTPELITGNTYSLYSGETKLCDVTLNNTITRISSDGSEAAGNMGGFGGGNRGGMRPESGQRPEGMTPPDGMEPSEWGDMPAPPDGEGRQRPPGEGAPPQDKVSTEQSQAS